MTAYFDKALAQIERADDPREAVQRMIDDCVVCVEWPDFSAESVRNAVHRAILDYETRDYIADDETDEQCLRRSARGLVNAFHGAFHSLARMDLDGWNDSPLTPIADLLARGEERREAMLSPPVNNQPKEPAP